MSDPNNLEGAPPTVEERAAMARELDAVAPTPADKFRLMLWTRPTPTPRTDAFSQRLTAAKVPASKAWSHWYCHATTLERELAEAREQRDRLVKAGKALVGRWGTPFWEDVPHAGKFIRTLSDAIAVMEGGTDE